MRSFVLLVMLAACSRPAAPAPAAPAAPVAPVVQEPALPAELASALANVDETDPRSVEQATRAAHVIGDRKLVAGLESLSALALRPMSDKLITAQIAAVRALGKLDAVRDRAAASLIVLMGRGTGGDNLRLAITGASINALGELHAPGAITPLLFAMYRMPALSEQVRRALVAYGASAAIELRKILRGEHAEVNRMIAVEKLDRSCVAPDSCMPVSAKDFYPAVALGDLHDPKAIPDLLVALARPALPAYYRDGQPSPSTQYDAVLDTIRRLGAPEAAKPMRALWASKQTELATRIIAAGTFAFVSRDDDGVAELGAIAADNTADDTLRQEAVTSFARLAHDEAAIVKLNELAKRYLDASGKKVLEAAKRQSEVNAADRELGKAKQAADTAQAGLAHITDDPRATAAQIAAATKRATAAEQAFSAARRVHRDKIAPSRQATSAAEAYMGFARLFQTHIARVEIAIRCAGDASCYAASLKLTPDDEAKNVARYVADIARWTADEKRGLLEAAVDRAMLELGKRGDAAQTTALLDGLHGQAFVPMILLALPKLANPPCPACIVALEPVDGFDAKILRAYYESAR